MDGRRHGSTGAVSRGAFALVLCALVVMPARAQAEDLAWSPSWRRVSVADYVVTPSLFALSGAIVLSIDGPHHASWSKPILFDTAVRDALVVGSSGGRKTASTVSDVLVTVSIVHPVLVDGVLVSWVGRQSPDVAWQLVWIDAEAYAVSAALNTAVKYAVARERPWGSRCPDGAPDCSNPDRYLSFYSGHSATAATGAGLTCAHHAHVSLYGSSAADASACVGAVALAVTTGALRIVADKHWASDVIVGEALGFASGYLIPTLLFYRSASGPSASSRVLERRGIQGVTVAPWIGPKTVALGISAAF